MSTLLEKLHLSKLKMIWPPGPFPPLPPIKLMARTWFAPCDSLSEWRSRQVPAGTSDRLQIVPDPAGAQNNKVLRVEVRDNDVAVNGAGNPIPGGWRAEVVGPDEDGSGRWARYGWSTMLTSDYPVNPVGADGKAIWQVITQWHQGDSDVGGSPPLAFIIVNDEIRLHVHRSDPNNPNNSLEVGQYFVTGLGRATWHKFEMDVRWAVADGWVRVRHNGVQKVDLKGIQTLFPPRAGATRPPSVYLKMGLYRKATPAGSGRFVLYHDNVQKWVPVILPPIRRALSIK